MIFHNSFQCFLLPEVVSYDNVFLFLLAREDEGCADTKGEDSQEKGNVYAPTDVVVVVVLQRRWKIYSKRATIID